MAEHARHGAPILRVAVLSPLRTLFDYLAPPGVADTGVVGARVRVPFGRVRKVGVVVERAETSALPASRLRRVEAVLDAAPLLDSADLELLLWAARYYHHPPGEVVVGTLPGPLRRGKPLPGPALRFRIAPGAALDPAALQRAPRQAAVIECLRTSPGGVEAAGLIAFGGTREALRALVERGQVEAFAEHVAEVGRPAPSANTVNAEQSVAISAVRAGGEGFSAWLLDGVTGSGKTEVYLALIADAVARGRQALVLIPEIGLTPQIVERFRRRLGLPLAILHSGLGEGERADAWARARDGRAPVVVGTRSAAFVPLARPGLIVVDEEHDASFKQQDGFRYSARDIAVARARRSDVPVVLGSATPSLESLHNAASGRYRTLRLPLRAGGASEPRIELLDLRGLPLEDGLSAPLLDAVAETLAAGEQSLVFLNRRGYAPVLMCRDCGWPADCARCDAHLVFHRESARLRCHHCGAERPVPETCPDCGGDRLKPIGTGTQRVLEALARKFPAARVERVDRDRIRRKGALEGLLAAIQAGEVDVLVGTQMLAKGHHFPNVTLVGIVDADGGLFGADFRAAERMAQLLVQVSGRAGRGTRPGRVLVQTHHPDHPQLRALIGRGYPAFCEAALEERRTAGLPPCAHVALLRCEAPQVGPARAFLDAALAAAGDAAPVRILGPVPAPMERRQGRFRMHLWLESDARRPLHVLLDRWLPLVEALPGSRRVRWSIDIDPQDAL